MRSRTYSVNFALVLKVLLVFVVHIVLIPAKEIPETRYRADVRGELQLFSARDNLHESKYHVSH